MVVGSIIGILFREDVLFLKPVGEIFLQLLVMAAIPLVFFNLLAGLSAVGTVESFGKIGLKVMVYYLISTAVAITIGLTVMSTTRAGEGMTLTEEVPEDFGQMPEVGQMIMDMVPTNIFKSFVEGELIQIVLFAVLLGIVVLKLPNQQKEWFQTGFERFAELMRGLVEFILLASPPGFRRFNGSYLCRIRRTNCRGAIAIYRQCISCSKYYDGHLYADTKTGRRHFSRLVLEKDCALVCNHGGYL